MDSYSIAFFGSSDALLDRVRKVMERIQKPVKLYRHSLDDAIKPAIQAVEEDLVEVIVSYRATANLLRRHVHVPVLSMQNLGISRFFAIHRAAAASNAIFVPLATGESLDTERLSAIFHARISCDFYSDTAELETIVRSCQDRHCCDTVVAGGVGCEFAKKYGLRSFFVAPNEDDIRLILENAFSIARANRDSEQLLRGSQALLNAVNEGIISVDAEGFVRICSRHAREMLSLGHSIIGRHINDTLPEFGFSAAAERQLPSSYVLRSIRGVQYVLRCKAVEQRHGIAGWLYTVSRAKEVITGGKMISRALSHGNRAKYTLADYTRKSPLMESVVRDLRRYARSDSTVLICGESGTGKEILAHALHEESPRRSRPFVSVNCGAIPESLLESELFGYEGGAFTGSRREGRIGLIETADTGTLFLDEINSLPKNVQLLLLRVLQEKEIRRVGSEIVIPLNVRIIAATNRSLIDEVRAGRLREDLFFRLNALVLTVPPLRRRPEDIRELAKAFAGRVARRLGLSPIVLPEKALERLERLPWPGNARELEFFVERLTLLCDGAFRQEVFETLFKTTDDGQRALFHAPKGDREPEPDDGAWEESVTRERILEALSAAGGRKARCAELLGVSRTTLWRLMRGYGMGSGTRGTPEKPEGGKRPSRR